MAENEDKRNDERNTTRSRAAANAKEGAAAPEAQAGEVPTQYATTYPVVTEGVHNTEFILSEANGHRSRDNAYLADPITIVAGTPLQKTAAATTDRPATYVVATTGANTQALALYSGKSVPVDGLRIAVLARDAEVNLRLINWGAMSEAEKVIGITTLATQGIICRI